MITSLTQLDLGAQYTYADYLTWNLKERVELIKGLIYKIGPAPTSGHQAISRNLTGELYNFLRKSKCALYVAPFDVRLTNKRKSTADKQIVNVVQPDLCVIRDPNKIDTKGCLGAPNLVIEIVSKGNTKLELEQKFNLYEENAVQEYWIVQPGDETVSVFDLVHDKYILRKIYSNDSKIEVAVLPGLVLDMKDIF
jgi:Uma2 family endonuclease